MYRKILVHIFLISIFMLQFLLCDDDQNNQQPNQQGNQNGDQGQGDKKDSRYYCDGFEFTCPFKKIRLLLHKIKSFLTPGPFHWPKWTWHNPFAGFSKDDKNKDNNNNDNNKQNGDSQNQQGGPNFDPPKFNPPDYNPQNPLDGNQGSGH